MATYFRDHYFSPRSREEARAIVAELEAIVDASLPKDAGAVLTSAPEELEGLSMWSASELREEETEGASAMLEEVDIFVDVEPPPTEVEAKARAHATTYAPSSFVFEQAALARLPACRSNITWVYAARVEHLPLFIAMQKRLIEQLQGGVIADAEGTSYRTLESVAAQKAKTLGTLWTKAKPATVRAPNASRPRKPARTRAAKRGEIESVAAREALMLLIEGDDLLARNALKRALGASPELVRSYAAVLLEEGANADAKVARSLAVTEREILEARVALTDLLDAVGEAD